MTLYNSQRDRLLGKPSIETERCPFCGRPATALHGLRMEARPEKRFRAV